MMTALCITQMEQQEGKPISSQDSSKLGRIVHTVHTRAPFLASKKGIMKNDGATLQSHSSGGSNSRGFAPAPEFYTCTTLTARSPILANRGLFVRT